MTEENIIVSVEAKFPQLKGLMRLPRPRRIFVDVQPEDFRNIINFCREELGFISLSTITGLDELDRFSFIYHLSREDGILINIKIQAEKTLPQIHTITDIFVAAEMYERELEDLLGVKVIGLKEGRRYPLPDSWPKDDHPLRKDWKMKVE